MKVPLQRKKLCFTFITRAHQDGQKIGEVRLGFGILMLTRYSGESILNISQSSGHTYALGSCFYHLIIIQPVVQTGVRQVECGRIITQVIFGVPRVNISNTWSHWRIQRTLPVKCGLAAVAVLRGNMVIWPATSRICTAISSFPKNISKNRSNKWPKEYAQVHRL